MKIRYIISCKEGQNDDDRDQAEKWKDIEESRKNDNKQEDTEEWERSKRK